MTSEKSYSTEQRLNALWNQLPNYTPTSGIGPMGLYLSATSWTDTGGLSNGWGKGSGFFKYRRFFTSIWFIAAKDLNCTSATNTDGTTILTAANAGWASPSTNHRLAAYVDIQRANPTNEESAALSFQNDGSVQCYGIAAAATLVSCYGILFVDI